MNSFKESLLPPNNINNKKKIQIPSQDQTTSVQRQTYVVYLQTHPAQSLPKEPLF